MEPPPRWGPHSVPSLTIVSADPAVRGSQVGWNLMAHQSLYRRYRPRRFVDVRGQDHVIKALRNAVAQGSEGHAYLFSGPRGTGKTSTARILAKALNCPNLADGEPCGECESCLSIEHGNSYDLFELDAASNNGVDAMRELISRTVVGSPGRTKVYILDEVHMLSPAASNALLKTLEEPPDHVCFVLATTDPQKVLATIRSRTQHFEFSLLSAQELTEYVRWIREDAALAVDDAALDHVVRQGRGSARDTLSALDMVVAAGGIDDRAESIDEILDALVDRDTARVMIAVANAVAQGREPRVLVEQLLVSLRDAFLASVHAQLDHLSDSDQKRMLATASALGTATITRSLESLGAAAVDMRQAADPRVPLEVALIRLTTPAADQSLDALVERVEDLERRLTRLTPSLQPGAGAASAQAPAESVRSAEQRHVEQHRSEGRPEAASAPAEPGRSSAPAGPAAIRAHLAAERPRSGPPPAPPAPPAPPPRSAPRSPVAPLQAVTPAAVPSEVPQETPAGSGAASAPPPGTLSPADVERALTESVIPTLGGMAKSLYSGGRVVGEVDGVFVFALDADVPERMLGRAEAARPDAEAALSARLGRPVTLRLTIGAAPAPALAAQPSVAPPGTTPEPPPPDVPDESEHIDLSELVDATEVPTTGLDKLVEAFPGAEVMEQES